MPKIKFDHEKLATFLEGVLPNPGQVTAEQKISIKRRKGVQSTGADQHWTITYKSGDTELSVTTTVSNVEAGRLLGELANRYGKEGDAEYSYVQGGPIKYAGKRCILDIHPVIFPPYGGEAEGVIQTEGNESTDRPTAE